MEGATIPGFILVILTACLVWTDPAWATGTNDENTSVRTKVSFVPGEIHEVCMTLNPPEELRYSFSGTGTLSFNLHYHADSKILYPVEEQLISATEDSFAPASEQIYCLMWTNRGSDTIEMDLEYKKSAGTK